MERREEAIPDADPHALLPMLRESAWSERAGLDPVAQEANRLLGGHADSTLLIDESGCPKQGTPSVGVARQCCGPLGKGENGPVGVFAALSRGTDGTGIDERLFLPEAWTNDPARCPAAGIPKIQRGFQRKTDRALTMIAHARQQGIGFAWVGFDGSDPALLRALADRGKPFVGDVHQDQRIDRDDPRPIVPPAPTAHGCHPTRPQAQTPGGASRPLDPAATGHRLAIGHPARRHQRPIAGENPASPGVALGWRGSPGPTVAGDRAPGNRHAHRDQVQPDTVYR